jgi:hypothetical protein
MVLNSQKLVPCVLPDPFHLVIDNYCSSNHLDTAVKELVFLVHNQIWDLNFGQ